VLLGPFRFSSEPDEEVGVPFDLEQMSVEYCYLVDKRVNLFSVGCISSVTKREEKKKRNIHGKGWPAFKVLIPAAERICAELKEDVHGCG
jgi:hypothetical protein